MSDFAEAIILMIIGAGVGVGISYDWIWFRGYAQGVRDASRDGETK